VRAGRILLLATLVVAIVTASVSCATERVRGSGNVVARDIAVPSFSRLEVGSAFQVTVSLGGQPSLTLRVDDNLDRHVDAGVDGDTLHIRLRRGTSVSGATLQAAVTAPSLAQIQGSGSSRIRLQDQLTGDDLRVGLSGASRLDGAVELRSMTADLSGASNVTLSGRAGSVSANASGASHLALEQLQVDSLEVNLSGASNAEVSVRRTISATLSGASSLRYKGSPTFTRQEISGGSSITRVS
jgi:Putative auto-transporter adhesin, head GIN domain